MKLKNCWKYVLLLVTGGNNIAVSYCDDSDLLLCTVWCGLRASRIFTCLRQCTMSSAVVFVPSFLWSRGPLSCYIIGPQLDHVRLN